MQKYPETFVPSGDHYRQGIQPQLAAPYRRQGTGLGNLL